MRKILVMTFLFLMPATADATCRRAAVVAHHAVAVPVVTAFVPLFSVGYNALPAAPVQPQQPIQGDPTTARMNAELLDFLKRVDARLTALERAGGNGGKVAPEPDNGVVTAARSPLTFLSDANRCGACHAGGKKDGGLDLSKGLDGLSREHLLAVSFRTQDPDAEDVMPPRKVHGTNKPLSDEEYSRLRKAVSANLKLAGK